MSSCPICKRRRGIDVSLCRETYSYGCIVASEAYSRGVLAGVEVAKRHIAFDAYGDQCGYTEADSECFIWTYVDREAAKLAGENGE